MAGVQRDPDVRTLDVIENVLVILDELNPVAVVIFQGDAHRGVGDERFEFFEGLEEGEERFAVAVGAADDYQIAAGFAGDVDAVFVVIDGAAVRSGGVVGIAATCSTASTIPLSLISLLICAGLISRKSPCSRKISLGNMSGSYAVNPAAAAKRTPSSSE